MNTENREQVFFDGHNDDIISLYQNRNDKELILTGEMGAKPTVFRWNSQGEKVQEFKGAKKGVSAVIGNQSYVVAACLDDDHMMYAWEAKSGKLIKF